ncbi:XRE family transcriptional regulator [Pseudophaeobacter arcticus]
MDKLGTRLREERERLGLTQDAWGQLVGVKKNAQFNYENNKRSPSGEYLIAAREAGADIAYILTGIRVPAVVKKVQEQYGHAIAVAKHADEITADYYIKNPDALDADHEFELDGQPFATVARHDVQAAAGGGYINLDGPPIDHLAFSKRWLAQNGIYPGSSALITARGASMEPSIYDGDLVMIDRNKREIQSGHIYVYNDPANGTRIKRLEVVPGHAIIIRSDNPDQSKFPTEHCTAEAMNAIAENIVGEVVWSGHKW